MTNKLWQDKIDEATVLTELARTCWSEADFDKAHDYLLKALLVLETHFGTTQISLLRILHILGLLAKVQDHTDETERHYKRALNICDTLVGQTEIETATQVKYLADLYVSLGLYDKVEPLLLRSLRIYETKLGPYTAPHALNLMELAVLNKRQGKIEKAQKFRDEMNFALQKLEEGKEAKDVRISLGKLADFFYLQDRLDDANLVFRYALLNAEEQEFPQHTFMAESLLGLARLYAESSNCTEAAGLYHRAIDCWTRIHSSESPEMLAICLSECAEILHRIDKHDEAGKLEQRLASLAK